jgi:hypothetical protein
MIGADHLSQVFGIDPAPRSPDQITRNENPSDRKFALAIRNQGINLSFKQISAAQWWSRLTEGARADLDKKHPHITNIATLYDYTHRKPKQIGGLRKSKTKNKTKGSVSSRPGRRTLR